MTSTIEERTEWFDRGVAKGAKYMVVVTDGFDHEDYPVFVPYLLYESKDGATSHSVIEDVRAVVEHYRNQPMQRVMEVFDLSLPRDRVALPGRVMDLP